MKTSPFFGKLGLAILFHLLLAGQASPLLGALLIDDYEDGIADWRPCGSCDSSRGLAVESGGVVQTTAFSGRTYEVYAQTNGSDRLFTVRDQRTLEFRVDLISANGEDAFASITFCSPLTIRCYLLYKDANEIVLLKRARGVFFWDDVAVKNDNVTLVLALTGQGPNVVINIRVLDNEQNGLVLYDRSVVDTPGQDTIFPFSKRGFTGAEEADPEPYLGEEHNLGVGALAYQRSQSAELVFDNLRYFDYPVLPQLDIQRDAAPNSVRLSWDPRPASSVALQSSSVDGPWTLAQERIALAGTRHLISVPVTGPARFFKLVRGRQFVDEFTGGLEPGYQTHYFGQPDWRSFVTLDATEDRFRVLVAPQSGTMGISNSIPFVMLSRPEMTLGDVSASLDILAWDHSKDFNCALVARRHPPDANWAGLFALFGLSFHSTSDPSRAVLWTWTTLGIDGGSPFDIDPTQQYRLVLNAVGDKLGGEIYDLRDLTTPVSTHFVSDPTLISGYVGMYFGEQRSGPQGGIDITVDNFFVTGTAPFQPLTITSHPLSQGAEPGEPVTFRVEAVGEGSGKGSVPEFRN